MLISYFKWFYSAINRTKHKERLRLIDEGYFTSDSLVKTNTKLKEWQKKLSDVGLDYEIPVTFSQVESVSGYLAELYLSGYPIFPVIADQRFVNEIKQMSSLIESHAVKGRYPLEFTHAFNDLAKYNQASMDILWWPQKEATFGPVVDRPGEIAPKVDWTYFNKLSRVDPYNLIYDPTPLRPFRVSYDAEYIGHSAIVRRIELIKLMEALNAMGELTNMREALNSHTMARGATEGYWTKSPTINPLAVDYAATDNSSSAALWADIFQRESNAQMNGVQDKEHYLVSTFSAFIVPRDFKLGVDDDMDVQCWRFFVVNMEVVIAAFRVDTADFSHSILHTDLSSDGFGSQAKSVGEWALPIQDIVSDLINTLLAANRRAIDDRGIYNPAHIDSAHFESANPAPKIPMRESVNMQNVRPQDAYLSVPYDLRGIEAIMPTIERLMQVTDMIGGSNRLEEGRMVKGNRSAFETHALTQGTDRKKLLMAIVTEYGLMAPLRNTIKWNILTKQSATSVLNRVLLQEVSIDPSQLRQILMDFQVLSGFNPRQKVAEADILASTMNLGIADQQVAPSANIATPVNSPVPTTTETTSSENEA